MSNHNENNNWQVYTDYILENQQLRTIENTILLKQDFLNSMVLIDGQLEILKEMILNASVLSDIQIEEQLGKDVIIHPFNKAQLQPSTYDIRLGPNFYRMNPKCNLKYFHPENGKHVVEYWGVVPDKEKNFGAHHATLVETKEQADEFGVNVGDSVIVINPGELILGHTIEFIGGRNSVTTMIKARSTMGRCGITICKCAGQGDNGFYDRYTLEIENHSQIPVVLIVGERVGHIIFLRTGPVQTQYNQKGNYQTSDNLDDLIVNWIQLNMIPSSGAKLIRQILANKTL